MPPFTTRALVIAMMGGTFAILANMLAFVMIGKINERVPEKERISYVWWGSGIRKRFKKLYPSSKVVLLYDFSIVLMILSFVLGLKFWVFS